MSHGLLAKVTTLAPAELAAGLHQLADRRLLNPTENHDSQLRHPLLAEAIRRRLVGPEMVDEHRRIAAAFAGTDDPAAAEVAEHWQRAGELGEEHWWRIRAARAAGERLASAQEAEQWLRVLDLWPDAGDALRRPRTPRQVCLGPRSRVGEGVHRGEELSTGLNLRDTDTDADELHDAMEQRLRGIATSAARLLADWALARGYATVSLETLEGNEASERVASKAGFVSVERYQAEHRGEMAWLRRWTMTP